MLVLPPFHRHGHGAQLLQTIYNAAVGDKRTVCVTVEDPSANCVKLRDFVDVCNCAKLASFAETELHAPFSDVMRTEAFKRLKISPVRSLLHQ